MAAATMDPLPPATTTAATNGWEWEVIFAGFTAAGTVGLLIVAACALHAAHGTWKASTDANEQMRKDSIARTRPYVFVDVVPTIGHAYGWDIKITNVGKSSAKNLCMEYDNWPTEEDNISGPLRTLFETPRTLPPGCSIRAYWRAISQDKFDDGKEAAGVLGDGKVTVSYTGNSESESYTECFDVLTELMGQTPVGEEGPIVRGRVEAHQFYRLGQRILARLSERTR